MIANESRLLWVKWGDVYKNVLQTINPRPV